MKHVTRYIPDEGSGEFYAMTEAVSSIKSEETFVHYPEYEKLEMALRSISSLWPEPPNCADIRECVGINDGKARTIVAVYALKIAREALGITTAGLDWED